MGKTTAPDNLILYVQFSDPNSVSGLTKVDRVACPWLIRRFIDPKAEFFFVPENELLETARKLCATPFDANRFPEVKLNHRAERCTFEAILEDYGIVEAALQQLALIVRGADVKGQEHIAAHQRR